MKKLRIFVCEVLVKLCNAILPEGAEVKIPNVEGYTASKVGMTLRYSEEMIKRLTADMEGSAKEARAYAIEDAKLNIATSIFNALVERKLIRYKVSFPKKGEINVTGELKVYIPNE